MPRYGDGTHLGGVSGMGEVTEYILTHAEIQAFFALSVDVGEAAQTVIRNGEGKAGDAHGVGFQGKGFAIDLIQHRRGPFSPVCHQRHGFFHLPQLNSHVRAEIDGAVGGGIVYHSTEGIEDGVQRTRLALVVAVVYKEHILLRQIQSELTAHTVEEEAVFIADPDLIPVAVCFPAGNAVGSSEHGRSRGGRQHWARVAVAVGMRACARAR